MQTTLPMNERGILFRSARHHTHYELDRWSEKSAVIQDFLNDEIDKRAHDSFKEDMVTEICLARYFFLINGAKDDLFDRFTEAELAHLLYCRAHPSWDAYAPLNLEELFIELSLPDHEDESSTAHEVLHKLRAVPTPTRRTRRPDRVRMTPTRTVTA